MHTSERPHVVFCARTNVVKVRKKSFSLYYPARDILPTKRKENSFYADGFFLYVVPCSVSFYSTIINYIIQQMNVFIK